jgi:hypothetical protein
VPLRTTKDDGGATEQRHSFKRKRVPPPRMRFVHGSANLPYHEDPTLESLLVSNYPSD